VTRTRPPSLRLIRIVVLSVACLAAGCDGGDDEARREYLKALELGKTGRPLEEQLAHVDRAVRLVPTGATYLEKRAGLLFGLGRLAEARVDYDRAVELADRPYLRFERADLLCALGEDEAAHADLDRAIAGQPENVHFYPRRALVRLALGRVAEARADVDHAIAASPGGGGESERYARAAVLLLEGTPAEALPDLDLVIANFSDSTRRALPRTVRLLAHAALDRPERAAAEFDRQALDAAAHWPELGYRYWLVRRGCANAFIVTRAGPLVERARSILAASESRESSHGRPPGLLRRLSSPDNAAGRRVMAGGSSGRRPLGSPRVAPSAAPATLATSSGPPPRHRRSRGPAAPARRRGSASAHEWTGTAAGTEGSRTG
jgi:tetratricopeptide (TPR) repeat protein